MPGDWSTRSTSARTGVVVKARGKRVYTHTRILIWAHIHTCVLTHKPCSRAKKATQRSSSLGPLYVLPYKGKGS